MADKILSIKLNIETVGADKLVSITKEFTATTDKYIEAVDKLNSTSAKINAVDAKRREILVAQGEAYKRLTNDIATANRILQISPERGNEFFSILTKDAAKYQTKLNETNATLATVRQSLVNLRLEAALNKGLPDIARITTRRVGEDYAAIQLREQKAYNKQRLDDAQDTANKLHQIELDRLRKDIEARNTIGRTPNSVALQNLYGGAAGNNTVRPEAPGTSEARQAALADVRKAREQKLQDEIDAYKENAERKIAAFREAISATNDHIINTQHQQALHIREEQERQAAIRSQSFAQRINSQPRVTSQGSQIDMTGTLTRFVQANTAGQQNTTITNANTTAVRNNTTARQANNAAVDTSITLSRNLFVRAAELIGVYRVFNTVLQLTKQALLAIPKAGLEQQATQSSILGIFGTEEGINNLKFVHQIALDAGQSLTTLEQAYRRYAPSAILAGAHQKDVNQSFKDFAEVGTILRLPEDRINSLFLALDQMYAKGVVQSEEVKKQLGNVLPGAVETFAAAMNMTPAVFMDAMKKNEIIAKDAVPKFAAHYRKIFGGPDDSVFNLTKDKLQSNLNRLETVYTDMNRAIFADTNMALNNIVKISANMVVSVTRNLEGIGQAVELLSALIITRLGTAAFAGLVTNFELLATKIATTTKFITGMNLPTVALVGSIGYLVVKVNELGLAYRDATGFIVQYKDQEVSLTTYLETAVIVTLEKITKVYTVLANTLKTITGIQLDSKKGWEFALAPLNFVGEALKQDIAYITTFTKAFKAMTDVFKTGKASDFSFINEYNKAYIELTNSSSIMDRAIVKEQEELLAKLKANGAGFEEVWKAVDEKRLKGALNIRTALENAQNIPGTEVVGAGSDATDIATAKASKMSNIVSSLAKTMIKNIESEAKGALAALKTQQEAIDDKLKLNQISFLDAYKERIRLAEEEYSIKEKALQKEAAVYSNKAQAIQDTSGTAEVTPKWNAAIEKWSKAVDIAAKKWGVDAELIKAVINKESSGNLSAVNRNTNGSVDAGLMQVNNKAHPEVDQAKLIRDATYSIDSGTKILAENIKAFPNDLTKAIAAYNVGQGGAKQGKGLGYAASVLGSSTKSAVGILQDTSELDNLQDKHRENVEVRAQKRKDAETSLALSKEELLTIGKTVDIDLLRVQGLKEQADLLELQNKYEKQTELLEVNKVKGTRDKVIELQSLEALNIKLNSIVAKRTTAETNYQAKVQEVNTLLNANLISQQEASKLLYTSKAEYLALQEKEIEQLNIILAKNKGNLDAQAQLTAIQQSKSDQVANNLSEVQSITQSGLPNELGFINTREKEQNTFSDQRLKDTIEAEKQTKEYKLTSAEDQNRAIQAINDKFTQGQLVSTGKFYSSIAGVGATAFESLSNAAAKMYGNNSKQARASFAAYKAMAIAQAIMTTATAVMSSFDSGAKVPIVGPVTTGPAYAAMAAALGAIQIATIAAQPMPQAHGGLDYVPENNQTYLLSKGERVLKPQDNKKLTNLMDNATLASNKQPIVNNNNKIVNVLDPSIVGDYLSTQDGENLIINIVNRNQAA